MGTIPAQGGCDFGALEFGFRVSRHGGNLPTASPVCPSAFAKMSTSMRTSLALAFLAIFPALLGQKNTVPTERWSNEKIWYSGTFRSEGVYGIRSMKDGVHYTSLDGIEGGNAVVKYAYAPARRSTPWPPASKCMGRAGRAFPATSFLPMRPS